MRHFKTYILFVLIGLFIVACRKDQPPVIPQQNNINITASKRLLICNEGNFGNNNASLSIYDPVSNSTIINAYAASNSNQSLGDVLQSVTKANNKYYLVVNNSGKIVVCNSSFVRSVSINGFISPRYMQVVSNNKAYVSNLILPNKANQTNYIQVVDLSSNAITKNIRVDGWSEQMVLSYGKVYITNQNKKYVYVIDAGLDKVTDSIYVGATTACIVKDENEKLWISCNADATNNLSAKLVKINPVTDSIEATVSLQTTQSSITRLCVNGIGNTLYYLMNDVFKMDVTTSTINNIIQQGSHTFYGLCIDPDDETIYTSDAMDYNSNGKIYRYQSNTTYVGAYSTGVIPGFLMIDK